MCNLLNKYLHFKHSVISLYHRKGDKDMTTQKITKEMGVKLQELEVIRKVNKMYNKKEHNKKLSDREKYLIKELEKLHFKRNLLNKMKGDTK